jgi:hypothetical protein
MFVKYLAKNNCFGAVSVLLVEEYWVPRENHRTAASH